MITVGHLNVFNMGYSLLWYISHSSLFLFISIIITNYVVRTIAGIVGLFSVVPLNFSNIKIVLSGLQIDCLMVIIVCIVCVCVWCEIV